MGFFAIFRWQLCWSCGLVLDKQRFRTFQVVESSLYLRRIQHCPTLPLSTTNKLLRYDSMDSKLYRSIQTLCGNRRH
ncbi:unnamed protein product [Brassica napus]|uniref:(rape) hypothetical protein n=1 Tax=Brassica napus TaxID=3708 RepID=A0A817BB99_BRANA|nr:unnamed protein product [Brassica napus]